MRDRRSSTPWTLAQTRAWRGRTSRLLVWNVIREGFPVGLEMADVVGAQASS
jgi:hypothetical protein